MEIGSPARYPPIVVIVGPTAAGKSSLAIDLARSLNGDIISADSRQVYRYMDIGTAKPSPEERFLVRHFMLDLICPDQIFSAQRFRVEGRKVLRWIAAAGRVALVVGGTGFYVRSLLDNNALPEVAPEPELRERLRRQAQEAGPTYLHDILARKDPQSAERIHPHNVPRLIRALEINEKLGGPVPSDGNHGESIPALYLGLSHSRDELHARADRRVISQIESGLIEETRRLLNMGFAASLPSLDGLAYRQAAAYLRGDLSLSETVTRYQQVTHQLIRRQLTWFRADDRIQWLPADAPVADLALQQIKPFLVKAVSEPPR